MGMGTGRGLGVVPEEHPSAWFASVKGRKRWILHPPNQQGPLRPMFKRDTCDVPKLYTVTRVCDQQEGDIMYLPGGWWHETCNLDDFSAGIGGVTFDGADKARPNRGRCGLSTDPDVNAYMNAFTGGQHQLQEIPYCAKHECHVLPQEAEAASGQQSLSKRM